MSKKLFDFAIGNPPYNEDFNTSGENENFAKPVYNQFMDASYQVADKVELIHPARFLFNAGSTPKDWNKKMLEDEHFKVLQYEPVASNIFPNTDIKGGVVITYHNTDINYGAINVFTAFSELNCILKKVSPKIPEIKHSLTSIISGRGIYRLSKLALEEHPEIKELQSKGHATDVGVGAFKVLNNVVFFEHRPDDGNEYVKFLGLISNKRVYRWGRKDYQSTPDSFSKYKVFIPKANGSGSFGETLSTPLVEAPMVGATETFLSIGCFDTKKEADSCLKYIKSKFARAMLGILKITQDNTRDKWKYVPNQDFSDKSDIDWSKPIKDIDQQLYRKYGLEKAEINFIESHVKEMS